MWRDVLPAIFGLLGVLVGAVANWLLLDRTDRRREQREERTAARLIAGELWDAAYILKLLTAKSYYPDLRRLPTDRWEKYGEALSGLLPPGSWRAVDKAYKLLRNLKAVANAYAPPRPDEEAELNLQLAEIEKIVREAINVLDMHAGLEGSDSASGLLDILAAHRRSRRP